MAPVWRKNNWWSFRDTIIDLQCSLPDSNHPDIQELRAILARARLKTEKIAIGYDEVKKRQSKISLDFLRNR